MRNLKKTGIFLGLFLILIFSVIIGTEKEVQQQQTYIPQVILNSPWGEKNVFMDKEASPESEFGVYDPYSRNPKAYDAGPIQGPSNFNVAPNGDIYICDIFNERIQRFSAGGQLVSVINIGGWRGYGDDLSVDENGNIYVLYSSYSPARVCKFNQQGNLLIEYVSFKDEDSKGMNIGGGPTKIFCDNSGRLFMRYYSEKDLHFKIFQLGTDVAEFAPEQQKATLRNGFVGVNGLSLNQDLIFGIIDGKMYLLDNTGKAVKEYKHGANPRLLVGTDATGCIYLHAFDLTKDVQLVRKYDPEGRLISVIELKTIDYAHHNLNKPITVDAQGNIYVFDSTKEGITLTKWSPSGASK